MNEYGNETFQTLEALIGKEAATKVFEFFEGSSVYFPKRIGLNGVHERIYAGLRAGASYKSTARKYGYTKSYIRKIERVFVMKERAKRKAQADKNREFMNSIERGRVQKMCAQELYTGELFE